MPTMLLIYTHKITPRFRYTMKQVFTRILGVQISLTTTVEDFIKHTGPKITYTKQPLQNEFFIRSNDLLFQQGINDFAISMGDWEGVPCFFAAGDRSSIPFDIFSASFFLLSRYEEYLPHVKDRHGRFSPKDSIAHRGGFLELPVVDLWAYQLWDSLKQRFPDITSTARAYKYTSLLDVTTSHCYAHRGLMRSVGGLFLDLGGLRLKKVFQRIKVWFRPSLDPFNNFGFLVDVHKKYRVQSQFFFQFASYSTYDKNVSPNNNSFRSLIKSIADYSRVSLAASYSSLNDTALLKNEKRRLEEVINRPVNCCRMRYNRVELPHTYRSLVEAEFTNDYTMGYTHEIGFRAGTCTPFYLYDLALELQQPIRLHPFALHDYALRESTDKAEIMEKVMNLHAVVKKVNGYFITIFSNELLGGDHPLDWKELYEDLLRDCHV
ncbi:MAG: polysaccharide deacetylase family protein [Bacteroidota bacterium]